MVIEVRKKIKQGRQWRVVRDAVLPRVTFEQRSQSSKEGSHTDIWGKRTLISRNSTCKGTEAGAFLAPMENHRVAVVA